ncbi:hypothetical protein P22_2479 [Propionispora sp. 2/2-37]|uniref:hypothetical protein n=1 Tax=Propionispora sp. 2/2-37 TaxID=1677858 RepID=UPI0006BB909C|nr:hypothetical protein [Propionispora sp. 2/2-37]CUH96389.1 hypothetical protein P22_2479 [Propionispora sp. 2/2-37]
MTIKKGDRLQSTITKQTYVVVGKWCGNWVLAPTAADQEVCLIYSTGELEEMVSTMKWAWEAR